MSTQIAQQTPTATNPAVYNTFESEQYDIFPSKIDGQADIETANAYPLMGEQAKRILFNHIWETINSSSRSDIDGEHYDIEWGYYTVTVEHHYECHDEVGGDSYCGIPEIISVKDVNAIEIVEVWDDKNETFDNILRDLLNEFGKQQKLS